MRVIYTLKQEDSFAARQQGRRQGVMGCQNTSSAEVQSSFGLFIMLISAKF